jgi:hypothetical protein
MNRKHVLVSITTSVALAIAAVVPAITLTASSASASAPTPAPSMPTGLLASSTPKTVVLNPTTGAVVSVTSGEPSDVPTDTATSPDLGITPDISGGTDCAAGDGCYYTPTVNDTYHDRSFYGSAGTFSGSWPMRNAWYSGNYTAYVCWTSACSSDWVGPNTYVTFGGSLVTGTSFTIQ